MQYSSFYLNKLAATTESPLKNYNVTDKSQVQEQDEIENYDEIMKATIDLVQKISLRVSDMVLPEPTPPSQTYKNINPSCN